jgi:hypothetical protein
LLRGREEEPQDPHNLHKLLLVLQLQLVHLNLLQHNHKQEQEALGLNLLQHNHKPEQEALGLFRLPEVLQTKVLQNLL